MEHIMKTLVLTTALFLFNILAFASSVDIVRVSDGSSAYCNTSQDHYRTRFQAYSVRSVALKYDQSDNASLSFSFDMKSCRKFSNGKYGFVVVNPMADFQYKVFLHVDGHTGQRVWNYVNARTLSLKGIAFKDGVYKSLYKTEVRGKVKMNIALIDLMTAEEFNKFQTGEQVKVSLDFMLQRTLILTSSRQPDPNREVINYGSFRFHFKVKKDGNDNLRLTRIK